MAMNKQEQSFFDKASDVFFKFAKNYMPSATTNAGLAASPLLAVGAVAGAMYAMAVMNRVPDALESAYFMINHPDKSMVLEALKGNLPFDVANKTYQYFAGAFGAGLGAAGLTKVIEKFSTLRDEADHLRRENEMLKREFASDRATLSADGSPADTLKGRLESGLGNMSSRLDQREQATRVKPGPGLR
ncbi:hypothetical protein HX878_22245 [Pseudomonas veronii]|uniref:hypothetical protein n=1 Tax=Pseudomonas veronii TaxID=76761 RepID=UPI0015A00DB6|nr:hypothetical protein [Pseudomonas veronii]NWD57448.1 hypothetical protein [Pseudomonas veronii]